MYVDSTPNMPRWHKTREITPDICLRHTDVNAIIRKRSRSFSMELVPDGKGERDGRRRRRKGLLLPAPEARERADFRKGREELERRDVVVRCFRNRRARLPVDHRIDNGVKMVREGGGGRERVGKRNFCATLSLFAIVSLLKTYLPAGAMATSTRSWPQISRRRSLARLVSNVDIESRVSRPCRDC